MRRGYQYGSIIPKVNDLLYMACIAENFVYMDHSAITLDHLDSDGLHPNFYGSAILKHNLLSAFRTFNPNQMNFRNEYDQVFY